MDGVGVFSFGVSVVPAHIKEHLALAGLAPQDLDSLILHQANRLMLETIAKKCRVPLSRTPMKTLARYGNLGAASIPALLCDEFGRYGGASLPADKAPPTKAMLCGFGAGLSWASCLLSLEKTLFMPPSTLKKTDYGNDRGTSIQNWHKRFADA